MPHPFFETAMMARCGTAAVWQRWITMRKEDFDGRHLERLMFL